MPRVRTSPARCRIAMPGGIVSATPGKNARDMLAAPHEAYLLFGGVEPWADGLGARWHCAPSAGASFVVAATPFADETLKSVAHVLLPIRLSPRPPAPT